jgi:hypothetical protein
MRLSEALRESHMNPALVAGLVEFVLRLRGVGLVEFEIWLRTDIEITGVESLFPFRWTACRRNGGWFGRLAKVFENPPHGLRQAAVQADAGQVAALERWLLK